MTSSVIVWGSIKSIEESYRVIVSEVLKGDIRIIAYVTNGKSNYRFWDGVPVCDVRNLDGLDCDYVINANKEAPAQIEKIINM